MTTSLAVDANEIAAFTAAVFRYAEPGTFVSLRSFREHATAWASISPVLLGDDLAGLTNAATDAAREAASDPEPTVFCPPTCTFKNGRKAGEKDLAQGVALTVECDQRPAAAQQKLEALLGPPTCIIESGGQWTDEGTGAVEAKLHLHWRLNEPAVGGELSRLKEARKLATALVGGDASNVPISHPIRWPGSLWRKQEPARLCHIVTLNRSAEIDLAQALEALRTAAGEFRTTGNGADRHTQEPGERVDVGELTRNILEGKNLHDSTLRLSASYLASGMPPGAVVRVLRDIMRTTPEPQRDARWQTRFDDLPRLVASGHDQYGDPFAAPLGAGWDAEELSAAAEAPARSEPPPQARGKPYTAAPDDDPLPLFETAAAASPYPVDALPDCIAKPIRAIAAKAQVPQAMAAQSVLSVLALGLQGHADVKLPYADVVPISEFFLTISDSGDRKTSSDRMAMKGVVRDRLTRALGYDLQFADWRIRHAAWVAQEASVKRRGKLTLQERTEALRELGSPPRPPIKPERIITNMTTEGILKMFGEALPALGCFNNEGAVVTGGYSMREENVAATGGTLSALWDGERTSKARAGEGHTVVDGCRFAAHLMIQPDLAIGWINNTILTGQGLFSRMLITWPESLKGSRLWRDPTQKDLAEIEAFSDLVFAILQRELPIDETTHRLTPRQLEIQPAALPDWISFYDRIEKACGPNQPLNGIAGFGEKAGQHAIRLAAVILLADDFEALSLGPSQMRAGIALVDWYVGEIVRVRSGTRVFDRDDAGLPAAQKLIAFLKSHPNGLPIREVLRRGPQELRTKSKLSRAIKLLNEHRWLEPGIRFLKLRKAALNG